MPSTYLSRSHRRQEEELPTTNGPGSGPDASLLVFHLTPSRFISWQRSYPAPAARPLHLFLPLHPTTFSHAVVSGHEPEGPVEPHVALFYLLES